MADVMTAKDRAHGRNAHQPGHIPLKGVKDVLYRVYLSLNADRVMLVAAGVTFYLLLAIFPAMAALVSVYGFVADPATIASRIAFLAQVMPSDGLNIFLDQLKALATEQRSALSFGLVFGLLVAVWSANNGVKAMFEAMNIAYGEDEKRSFIRLNLVSLTFTLGALVAAVILIVALGVIPAMIAFLSLGKEADTLFRFLRWPLLLVLATFGICLLYRYGPSREAAKMRWLTWGAALAALTWLLGSLGVTFYLSHVANYNATYGTLGALVGFLFWTWISAIIVIMGAELNAELEHQTAIDSTTGDPKPMGSRGAAVADTLGDTVS
ncbi:YihY/virulence factor BrkB family protein [Rhizobium helianthi]|uniref:YihY/virulence factor BrkB family protein n=1 Tax=Rhizobium helianthi TaxID=1132695 RepID=A0ABW4M291_9HYPH